MEHPENLFSEFSPASFEDWLGKATSDLKGEHPNSLVSATADGILIQPYYTQAQVGQLQGPISKDTSSWMVAETIARMPESEANKRALETLNAGVSALAFEVDGRTNYKVLLKDILVEHIRLRLIVVDGLAAETIQNFYNEISDRNLDKNTLSGCVDFDIIGRLAETGNWVHANQEKDEAALLVLLQALENSGMAGIFVNGTVYQQAGATPAYELGVLLAHVHEYLVRFEKAALPLHLQLAAGSDFFLEIAKFRAIRLLVHKLLVEYEFSSQKIVLHGTNSLRNKSIYDPHVNLLRTTAETMSAVLGGCDVVETLPYDVTFRAPSSSARRIARNQQLLMQFESYFEKVADPGAGAYFIENLTHSLCEKAWGHFQEIEATGGLLEALKKGQIQKKISEQAQDEQSAFENGKIILVGVNKFEKKDAGMADKVEQLSGKHTETFTVNRPLHPKRLAEELEALRFAAEQSY
jgi:methylmalonyl-CoA mutase